MKYLLSFTGLFLLVTLFGGEWYEAFSISSFVVYFFYFLNSFSKKVLVFELTALMAILTWLVVPMFFYKFFTVDNELASLWDKYMRVPPNEYYTFVIPATALMILALQLPLRHKEVLVMPKQLFGQIRQYLSNKPIIGVILISLGLLSTFFTHYAPSSLKFILYLFEHLSFVGLLYLYFSKIPMRKLSLLLGVLALLYQSISSAMFGELVFITYLTLGLLLSTQNISNLAKTSMVVTGLLCIILLQSIKHEYRNIAWEDGADPVLFGRIIANKVANPSEILDAYSIFSMASRANQGWHIGMTMYHVPKNKPYANGETIFKSFLAVLIPRFLWSNKPESGGKENLKRFWGMELRGYSMNIGPIGEAYANFGKLGGIIFMFFYGLLLNGFLSHMLGLVKKHPTLLLWFPILFLYPIGTETDILSTLNPLFKIGVFIAVLYSLMPYLLGFKLG